MKMSANETSRQERCGQGEQLSEGKKYPDYCRTITFTDSNGVVRELVFPKALDLDRPKRARTTFSREQLDRLESEFNANQYLVGRERSQLARNLGLSETQVKVWFQNRRTKHKRDKEKQAEHHEAKAESLATQNLLHILHPPREAPSPVTPHPESPGLHLRAKSEELSFSSAGVAGISTSLALPFKVASHKQHHHHQHQHDQLAHRLVDVLRPPLNNPVPTELAVAAANHGSHAASFAGYPASSLPSPSLRAVVSSPVAVSPVLQSSKPASVHAAVSAAALSSLPSLPAGCPQGVGIGMGVGVGWGGPPAELTGPRSLGYHGGVTVTEAWLGHHDPYLACHPQLGSAALHVRLPPAWPLYPHLPQSMP